MISLTKPTTIAVKSWQKSSLRLYLTVFNVLLFLGHLFICVELIKGYVDGGAAYFPYAWASVARKFKYCLLMQSLEIMHALLGWTKTGWMASAVQVGGRALMIVVILDSETRMQSKPMVFYLFVVYSLIEIFRWGRILSTFSPATLTTRWQRTIGP